MLQNLKKDVFKHASLLFILLGITQQTIGAELLESDSDSWLSKKPVQKVKKKNHSSKRKIEDAFSCEEFVMDPSELAGAPLAGLNCLGLSPLSVSKAHIYNAALYIEDITVLSETPYDEESSADEASEGIVKRKKPIVVGNIDLTKFTPQKIEDFKKLGGQTPDLRKNLAVLKKLQPSPIRDVTNFPRSNESVLSPAARLVMPREVLREGREIGLVLPLPPIATVEPVEAETEEQRLAREERQIAEFNAVESQLSSVPKLLEEKYETALKPWKPYFDYIDLKKKRILSGKEKKMRWPDLVGAFLKYVAPHMTMIEVDGYEVYFTFETLNFNRKGRIGINHEDMSLGYCPKGADMELMNYHHVTKLDPNTHKVSIDEQTQAEHRGPYKIALIPNFLHEEYSYYLHCESDTCVLPQRPVERSLFDKPRQQFNKKIVELYFKG